MTVRMISLTGESESAYGDQRVVEAGHHRGHAVDQLKTEPEINQHAEHGVQGGQCRLPLQLLAHGGTDHIDRHAVCGLKELL